MYLTPKNDSSSNALNLFLIKTTNSVLSLLIGTDFSLIYRFFNDAML